MKSRKDWQSEQMATKIIAKTHLIKSHKKQCCGFTCTVMDTGVLLLKIMAHQTSACSVMMETAKLVRISGEKQRKHGTQFCLCEKVCCPSGWGTGWVWSPSSRKPSRTGKGRCRLASLAGGKGTREQGSLSSPVAWRAEQQCLTQSHSGSRLEGTGREQALQEGKVMVFSFT